MDSTGRIQETVPSELRRLAYGNPDRATELDLLSHVDLAHVVMLTEQGVLDRRDGAPLLESIRRLRASRFAELAARDAPRGLYLMYENYLADHLGSRIAGSLQLGRSRNDHTATCLRLRLRERHLRTVRAGLDLVEALVDKGRQYRSAVMPAYTHGQPAVPITFEHYLLGVARALMRALRRLDDVAESLALCPLGAGSIGGTTVRIAPERTAGLLGFTGTFSSSVEAIASRDVFLEALAGSMILGVTASRLAADLLQWLTDEFAFLRLPDSLVGSSSMMPQKRNPFLLEHAQGRLATCAGALTTAAVAMHGKPYTNSIAAGSEAIRLAWDALDATREGLHMLTAVVAGLLADTEAMRQRAVDGFTVATFAAERIAQLRLLPFREAHHLVGEAVNRAAAGEGALLDLVSDLLGTDRESMFPEGDDPAAVVERARFGGGPSSVAVAATRAEIEAEHAETTARVGQRETGWNRSWSELDEAVTSLLGTDTTTGTAGGGT
ncbi:Argininosuccinate lyase [Parafrankia sp. Ea1.12]|uniref:lyase family protein n=1 Tax=Parafrankia sp. Ea1.12 TaxID=573499 RepID=UPI000DA52B88|nr:lyase family protein [Parafrankia sp. Ea1.12]SQD97621.1 Argininosuccinate lyase [Parafrankia sp. Ea1.12]